MASSKKKSIQKNCTSGATEFPESGPVPRPERERARNANATTSRTRIIKLRVQRPAAARWRARTLIITTINYRRLKLLSGNYPDYARAFLRPPGSRNCIVTNGAGAALPLRPRNSRRNCETSPRRKKDAGGTGAV